MCDEIIKYDNIEGRSEELKHALLHNMKLDQFSSVHPLMKSVADGLTTDPENLKPLIPITQSTFRKIRIISAFFGVYFISEIILRFAFGI